MVKYVIQSENYITISTTFSTDVESFFCHIKIYMNSPIIDNVDSINIDKYIEKETKEITNADIQPTNENEQKCAPGKLFEDGSCSTLNNLVIIAEAYNKANPKNPIKLSNRFKTLHPRKYKRYLVKKLKKRITKCTTQLCWLTQDFMKYVKDNLREEIENNSYRPTGPSGKFEWLNTIHINDVMGQYQQKYPEFKFMGAVPIDFDDLPDLGIADLDFAKLKNEGTTKLGFIFNLDEHWKSGSHWVALYVDLNLGQAYIFDSYGIKPDKRIRKLMIRLNKFFISIGIKDPDINYNNIRHQYKNSECGVYSINFIVRMLRGVPFLVLINKKIPDDKINKCRSVYFTKK